MPTYNWKRIVKVPPWDEFIDIILSMTQRKTPTVNHKGWAIERIQRFYIRKVKYTQDNFSEKLQKILDGFPRLDDIHAFYRDLINVLYSRDHYKVALGSLNTAKSTIDSLGREYIKQISFGDSQYRCKSLKRMALGRMCTVIKKIKTSLAYLEQVRQHLSRLPSIEPDTRSLLVTGYPSVGKSSFLNMVSRADVEVQPYAFTTQSLFVGHFYHTYDKWQVIDTPGILDRPLSERNTIEMQAMIALARLQASILYFIDISETCGFSIEKQVSLLKSIMPVFANKPLVVVLNKIDIKAWDDVPAEDRALIESIKTDRPEAKFFQMSTETKEGVEDVKDTACRLLKSQILGRKMQNTARMEKIANRMQIQYPPRRDNKVRESVIPASVLAEQDAQQAMKATVGLSSSAAAAATADSGKETLRDIERKFGGPGRFKFDTRIEWMLKNPEWRQDIIPQIYNGHNVADWMDEDIEAKVDALMREEELLEAKHQEEAKLYEGDRLTGEQEEILGEVRELTGLAIADHRYRHSNNNPRLPRNKIGASIEEATTQIEGRGLDPSPLVETLQSRQKKRRRPNFALEDEKHRKEMEEAGEDDFPHAQKRRRGRSRSIVERFGEREESPSRARSLSRAVPFDNPVQAKKSVKKVRRDQARWKMGRGGTGKGEADRVFLDPKPKHLYTGKMSLKTRDRR